MLDWVVFNAQTVGLVEKIKCWENTLSEGGRRGSKELWYIKDILGCVYCTCCYIRVKAALLLIRTSRKEFHSQTGSNKWTEWCCERSNKATHRSSRSYFWWVCDREPKCKENPHSSPCDCQQNQTNSRPHLWTIHRGFGWNLIITSVLTYSSLLNMKKAKVFPTNPDICQLFVTAVSEKRQLTIDHLNHRPNYPRVSAYRGRVAAQGQKIPLAKKKN